jgi:hypothetical protein
MSKTELKYTINTEIDKINRVIDQKILRGLSYTEEARYHNQLLKQLHMLYTRNTRSFFKFNFGYYSNNKRA